MHANCNERVPRHSIWGMLWRAVLDGRPNIGWHGTVSGPVFDTLRAGGWNPQWVGPVLVIQLKKQTDSD